MSGTPTRTHRFHAEATAFHGELVSPLPQRIPPHAFAKLKPEGGYLSQDSVDFRLERIITFKSSHTQVSGRVDPKPGHAYATLATSVVEGLNILEVITADRIVSQVSTVHYEEGYTPSISFLGTRFENLRIGGEPVDLKLDLGFIGGKPDGDVHYHDHPGFIDRVKSQYDRFFGVPNPPAAISRYTKEPVVDGHTQQLEFSLVKSATCEYPGIIPVGPTIIVPDFGAIHLAVVKLHLERQHGDEPPSTTIELTMIQANLGCLADGTTNVAVSKTNGSTAP